MKVTKSPRLESVKENYACGTTTFASYRRIIDAMIRSGELLIDDSEKIVSVCIEPNGLVFQIKD